jgi:hypothetical protein
LNEGQSPQLIHFWVDRGTQRVFWEFTEEALRRFAALRQAC